MIKNRFFKTTQGVPFELAIGTSLAAPATMRAFVESGTAGQLAAFVVDTNSSQPTGVAFNSALSAANKKKPFFLAFCEKVTGTERSITSVTPLIGDNIKAELVAYKAPANQSTQLGLAAGTIDNDQELSFKVVETTPGNLPLPVWDYLVPLTGGAAVAWGKIIAKINQKLDGEFFTASGAVPYVAPTIGAATRTANAVTSVALTTPGSGFFTSALPSGNGTVPIVFTGGGGTGAAAVLNVVNGVPTSITVTAGGSGYTTDPTASIAAQTSVSAVTITSTNPTRHFKLVAVVLPTKADYADYGVSYVAGDIVKASAGSGTADHVRELQIEANVRRGITHYYPNQNATAAEFGLPVDMTGAQANWDIVVLTGFKTEDSPTPKSRHVNKHYIFVAVPAGSGSQIVAMFA